MDRGKKQDALLTPAEVQAWLGCGRTKVYELLQRGEIPSFRVGRLVRVRCEDVETFLEHNRYGVEP